MGVSGGQEAGPQGGRETAKERAARLLPLGVDAESAAMEAAALDTVYGHVANGGSLIDLAKTWGIRYSDLSKWITRDKNRKEAYESAVGARDEWMVQAILKQLNDIVGLDIREAFNEWGGWSNVKELPSHVASAVVSIKIREEFDSSSGEKVKAAETTEVKFSDKIQALALLGKQLMMFIDRRDVTSAGQAIQVITGVPESAAERSGGERLSPSDIPPLN
jgi:hypothetical protein